MMDWFSWRVTKSNRWVDEAIRNSVETFVRTFFQTHGWVETVTVVERFVGAPGRAVDLWRRKTDASGVPTRGPDNVPYPEGANQSDNAPILIFRVKAEGIKAPLEVSMRFPDGRATEHTALTDKLSLVRRSLESSHRSAQQ